MTANRSFARVNDASAWKGETMQSSREWLTLVTDENIADMERALGAVRAKGLGNEQIGPADFPVPSLQPKLSELARDIEFGRGFALLRGMPVLRWGMQDATTIYWGISTHIGTPTSQNRQGDKVVLVKDLGLPPGLSVRAPHTTARLYYHSDYSDIVSLMCMHPAQEGGTSRICSSIAIYNALVDAGRTALIAAFYDGFPFDRKDEQPPNLPIVAEHPIPMLAWHQNRLSFRYFPGWSEPATKRTGIPWTAIQKEALDEVNRMSNLPEYYLDMQFQVGDIQYLNNYSVIHSRTEFVDYPEPERKRVLVRLWLKATLGRELPRAFDELFGPYRTRDGIKPVAAA